jgi:predicted nucleotidyltransferase
MVTQQAVIEEVKEFAKEIKALGLHLRKVYLFGSFAQNQQQEYSDIDVALVADEFVGIGFDDIDLFGKALIKHILIQPKTYPTAYFEKGDPFIDEIKRTGIVIDA